MDERLDRSLVDHFVIYLDIWIMLNMDGSLDERLYLDIRIMLDIYIYMDERLDRSC